MESKPRNVIVQQADDYTDVALRNSYNYTTVVVDHAPFLLLMESF